MKRITYLTIVDISEKNGQGIYALKTLEAFSTRKDVLLNIVLPKPKDIGVLNTIKLNNNLIFLKTKNKKRDILWHLLVQIQLFLKLLKIGKQDALIYSMKPTMIAPIIYSKIYKVSIYLLVEGLAKNTIKTLVKGVGYRIALTVLIYNIKSAKRIYPAYKSAKVWIDNILYSKNSEIIHCGVDANIFRPHQKEKTDKLTIGYVGSFRKEHLILELIKASKELDIKILLIGDGQEKKKVIKYVEYENLSQVRFLGEKNQNEISQYFKNCDVMWAATMKQHWGIPIKCFEYLACNKKVIYTKKEDFDFIGSNNYGYGLEETYIKTIGDILKLIYHDYKSGNLKDNENSRSYIMNNNDWNNFSETIINEIKHV